MARFFYKLIGFLLVIYLIGYFLFLWMEKVYNGQRIICDKSSWVQHTYDQKYDLAVLGSSRALNNVVVKLLDDSLRTRTINIATSGGGYAENYITLYNFLKNGNSTGSLLLQVDGYNLESKKTNNRVFNEQYYMNLMGDDTISAVIKDYTYILKYYCWKFIPVTRYMEFNFRYSFFKAIKGGYNCTDPVPDTLRGFEPLLSNSKMPELPKDSLLFSFGEKEQRYLEKIIVFCKVHQIHLLLFTAPEYKEYLKMQKNRDDIVNYYSQLASHNNISFADNSEFAQINAQSRYFRDFTHLNKEGAYVFTKQLIPIIERNLPIKKK